ncbi:MAG: hypothetical protein U0169_04890 [Polyangiaceae bacterium]
MTTPSLSFASRGLALVVLLTLSLFGCSADAGSETEGGGQVTSALDSKSPGAGPLGNKCACEDLACWRKETDEKTVKQFECAKSALDAAATLSSGGSKIALDTASGMAEMAAALGKNDGELLTFLQNVGKGTANLAKELAGDTSLGQCIGNGKAVVNDVLAIIKASNDIAKKQGNLDAEALNKIIGMMGRSLDATFKFAGAMNECMSLAGGSKSTMVQSFRAFLKAWDKVLGTLKAALAILECGPTIAQGGQVLVGNASSRRRPRQAKQNKSLQASAAYVGSRIFNHAKYTGCTEAVKDNFFASADTKLDRCRNACGSLVDGYVPENNPLQRGSWIESCKLMCSGTFGNNGNTQMSYCDDVKQVFHVSRTFRHIYLEDGSSGEARLRAVQSRRHDVVTALRAIDDNWSVVSPDDDQASFEDLASVIGRPEGPLALEAAAHFFTKSFAQGDSTYFFQLLETAGTDGANPDKVFTRDEVRWFRDEVSEYSDDSEIGR